VKGSTPEPTEAIAPRTPPAGAPLPLEAVTPRTPPAVELPCAVAPAFDDDVIVTDALLLPADTLVEIVVLLVVPDCEQAAAE